jgi:hypothetical protein
MVTEFCFDLFDGTGKLSFPARRCVQCGEVIDSIILKNRQHPPVSAEQKAERSARTCALTSSSAGARDSHSLTGAPCDGRAHNHRR